MSRKFIVLPLLEIDRAAAEIADGADDGKATPHGRVARAWGRPVLVPHLLPQLCLDFSDYLLGGSGGLIVTSAPAASRAS